MNQKGSLWYDHKQQPVTAKYVSVYDKASEKAAATVFNHFQDIEIKLQKSKAVLIQACKGLYNEYLKLNKPVTVFAFTNFDKSVRVEFDTQKQHIRCYVATKPNPGYKDYELIVINFNEINLGGGSNLTKEVSTQPGDADLPGASSGEGEHRPLLQGKDRSQDLFDVPEGGDDNSEVKTESEFIPEGEDIEAREETRGDFNAHELAERQHRIQQELK